MRLLPIPRPSRLRAVWLTYRTQLRWWSWPLAIGLVVFAIVMASEAWPPRTHNLPTLGTKKITEIGPDGTEVVRYVSTIVKETPARSMESALPRPPAPAPDAQVAIKDGGGVEGREPEWSKLRSLTLNRGWASCPALWTLGALPLLESLVVQGYVQDKSIVRLCELYDLKSLTLIHAGDLTTTAMESLAREPRLEFLSLDISHCSFDFPPLPGENPFAVQQREAMKARTLRNAPTVAWPASLKTLYFEDNAGTTLARLEEWQQLPQLRCLVTRLNPVAGNRLDDEAVALLQRFPQLRLLSLRDPAQGESDLAIVQQRRLPRLSVRPMMYDPTRGKRASIILLGGLVVLLLLHFQLAKQFVTSANRLKPHFARSHLLIPAGVIAVLAGVSFVLYRVADCPTLVACGLCMASVATMACGLKALRSMTGRSGTPVMANVAFVFPAAVFPFMGVQLALNFFGAEIDWFLRGQYPWLAVVVLAVSVWGACDLAAWLRGLSRDLEEGGCANVPLGSFDPAGWAEWSMSAKAAKATGREKTPLSMRRQERRLDRMVSDLASGKKFTQYELWRLAVPMTFLDWIIIFVPLFGEMMISFGLIFYFFLGSPFDQSPSKLAWPFGIQMIVMGLIMPLAQLAQRHPMLAMERLRPVTREDWTKTWFRGVLWELAPLPVLLVCATLTAQRMGMIVPQTIVETAIGLAAAIGAIAVIVALSMFAITLRSRWWLVAFVVLGVGCGVGMVSFLSEANLGAIWSDSVTAACLIAVLHAAAFGLWQLAQWRWREWELAMTEQ